MDRKVNIFLLYIICSCQHVPDPVTGIHCIVFSARACVHVPQEAFNCNAPAVSAVYQTEGTPLTVMDYEPQTFLFT